GDHDDALRARADPDVAAEPERLRLRAGVRDEERAGDREGGDGDREEVPLPREDVRHGGEHEPLADAVDERVEEGAEGRLLATDPRERAVEDVEDGADDERRGAGPEEEDLVAVLEGDEERADPAERHAERGELVRRHPRPREPGDRARRDPPNALLVALL